MSESFQNPLDSGVSVHPDFKFHSVVAFFFRDTLFSLPKALHVEQSLQIIQTEHGDVRVLQATPDQIAKLHQAQQLKIITSSDTIATIEENVEPVQESKTD